MLVADKFVRVESMKRKQFFGIILAALVLMIFLGCKTPPPAPAPQPAQQQRVEVVKEVVTVVPSPPDTLLPLTNAILQRLNDSSSRLNETISNYQLVLFGRIFLEREYTESETAVESGKARFEDVHVRENVTINDQTEGQALDLGSAGAETVISVCFEDDEKYQLSFSTMSIEPDGFFYLQYNNSESFTPFGDEKGILNYGGETYKLKYAGEKRPHLLIKLSQKDTDRLNSRTASGRKVE